MRRRPSAGADDFPLIAPAPQRRSAGPGHGFLRAGVAAHGPVDVRHHDRAPRPTVRRRQDGRGHRRGAARWASARWRWSAFGTFLGDPIREGVGQRRLCRVEIAIRRRSSCAIWSEPRAGSVPEYASDGPLPREAGRRLAFALESLTIAYVPSTRIRERRGRWRSASAAGGGPGRTPSHSPAMLRRRLRPDGQRNGSGRGQDPGT